MQFVQTITVRTDNVVALTELMAAWHETEHGVAPGYQGSRLLADRDNPGRYVVLVDFSSLEEAEQNNDRPQTAEWAAKLAAVIDGEAEFGNFDEIQTV